MDEEFQTLKCWCSDISQCIGLSTKEPTYRPDIMDLTPTITFQHLFGGFTFSIMTNEGDEHYQRLLHALRSHIFHTNTWDSTKCTKMISKSSRFWRQKRRMSSIDYLPEDNLSTCDTLGTIYSHMICIKRRFEMCRQIYFHPLLIQHLVGMFLAIPDIHLKMSILLIHQQLQVNLFKNGADCPFKMGLNGVYHYLNIRNF